MTASAAYIEWLKDALSPLGHIGVKRMFGGAGVYCDGLIIALVDDDQLYLKTDTAGQAAFVAEGQSAFTYDTKHGPGQLKTYWRAPDSLADDTDELVSWALRALSVARRAAVEAKPKAAIKRSTKKREGKPRA
jgi:DNA transformation protein and related proteins